MLYEVRYSIHTALSKKERKLIWSYDGMDNYDKYGSMLINSYWLTAGAYIWRPGKGEKNMNVSNYYKPGKESYKEKRGKKVAQLAKEGKVMKEYLSISDAARETGIPFSNISRAVKGSYLLRANLYGSSVNNICNLKP